MVIRNVILHVNGEQPLLADLYEPPSPGDVGLRCTNLRMMNGKRPVFVDDVRSIFFFPYLHVRFLEIPPASTALAGIETPASDAEAAAAAAAAVTAAEAAEAEADLELDEDFLRRIRDV